MPKKDKELPLLNSERKELLQRIKDAENRADEVYGVCHRKFTGIIVLATYLTEEQKSKLIEQLNLS